MILTLVLLTGSIVYTNVYADKSKKDIVVEQPAQKSVALDFTYKGTDIDDAEFKSINNWQLGAPAECQEGGDVPCHVRIDEVGVTDEASLVSFLNGMTNSVSYILDTERTIETKL